MRDSLEDRCDCCGFKMNEDLTCVGRHKEVTLCLLCANIIASKFYTLAEVGIIKTICYVGNSIIQEIRKLRGSDDQSKQ